MPISKELLIQEVNIFNERKNLKLDTFVNYNWNNFDFNSFSDSDIERFILNPLFSEDTFFISKKNTKAKNYKDWLEEVNNFSDALDAFIVLNDGLIKEQIKSLAKILANKYQDEYDNYYEEEESSYYDDEYEDSFYDD